MSVTRPRRSPATPTVAMPAGPSANNIRLLSDFHPEAMDYCVIAAEIMLQYRLDYIHNSNSRNGRPPKPPVDADMIVSGFVNHVAGSPSSLAWKTMLNVVLEIGLADPRYNGVRDTVVEQKCAKCRKVRPISGFNRLHCEDCKEDEDADLRVGMQEYALSAG